MNRQALCRQRNSISVLCLVALFTVLSVVCLSWLSLGRRRQDSPEHEHERVRREARSAITNQTNITQHNDDESSRSDEYPDDVFSLKDKRQGGVILHVLGLCYMFLALATVSDEFFIPTLEVIIEEFSVSEDVAGATFMAAGGSAPELFTSLIGVFIANSNVGFGTIVGSAVFNVLFVIGMCAVFSEGALKLTWWPLFRDCFFYSIALTLLIVFFLHDRSGIKSRIYWWETTTLIAFYFVYVIFMKYNEEIEKFVKRVITPRNRVSDTALSSQGNTRDIDLYVQKALGYMKDNSKEGQCFRFGVLQLVMRTMDPLRDASVGDLVREMESINNKNCGTSSISNTQPAATMSSVMETEDATLPNSPVVPSSDNSSEKPIQLETVSTISQRCDFLPENDERYVEIDESLTELPSPLDLSWPTSFKDRIVYIIRAPILFALHFTLSDVRKPEKRGRYAWTFCISILWIVIFSYFMVWWAKEISVTMGIDDEIMGLTVLAAGTSIPDLITSVLVARKGYGDMAVSSSVGSNMFDVTVGLPLPWLIWSTIHNGKAFEVTSSGLFCSTIMLFAMLLTVVVAIAVCKWQMSSSLGVAMLVLYVLFVVLSVLLQKGNIQCPF